MGHPVIETPNLDRLAANSVTWTRGYVPTSLCRPSLATMITGRYPHEHFITGNDPAPIRRGNAGKVPPDEYQRQRNKLIGGIDRYPTLPDLLKQAGYASHQSGKWWEGNFSRGGFDAGMTHGDPKRGGRHGDEGLKIGRNGMKPVFDFIDAHQDEPFFIWYAPFLPHTPHTPPKRLLDKYSVEGRPAALAKYYAMVEWFDETCGSLVQHLEERGLEEDTVIVYVTDNGWIQKTPETQVPDGWRYGFAPGSKQMPQDGGVRTPIMISWPGHLDPKMDREHLVSSIDLLPTMAALAGVEAPEGSPGLDLLSSDNALEQRDTIFGEGFAHDVADLDDPQASLLYRWCIRGRWKLIESREGEVGRYKVVHGDRPRESQLFDILADPHEQNDLAQQHPKKVEELTNALQEWWAIERRE